MSTVLAGLTHCTDKDELKCVYCRKDFSSQARQFSLLYVLCSYFIVRHCQLLKQCKVDFWMKINNELERIWKETELPNSEVEPRNFPRIT
jgi:hypothetical protein